MDKETNHQVTSNKGISRGSSGDYFFTQDSLSNKECFRVGKSGGNKVKRRKGSSGRGNEIQRSTECKILKVDYSFVTLVFSFVATGVARSGGMCTMSFGVFLLTTSLARMQATGVILVKRSFQQVLKVEVF